jgi:hypothetical protein
VHNSNVLDPPLPPGVVDPTPGIPFAPDLSTEFDHIHFARPQVPPHLVGADLSNPIAVPDAELLAFLGESADLGCPGAGVGPPLSERAVHLSAHPNPFRKNVTVRLAGPESGTETMSVFDVHGRRVATLQPDVVAGSVSWTWDGRDPNGRDLQGVFLVRLDGAGRVARQRIVRLR